MDKRPIGVFDSGLGGLSVIKELNRVLPDENIVYFGDTGRVPYGTRSRDTIKKYALQDEKFLLSRDVKLIVALLPIALDTFPGNQGFAPGYISIQVPLRARFKASPPLFYRFAYRLRAAAIVLAEQAAGRRLFNLYGLSSLFRF